MHGPLAEPQGLDGTARPAQRRGEQFDVLGCEAKLDEGELGERAVLAPERGAQSAYGQVAQRLQDGPGRAPSWRRVGMRTLHRVRKHEACELVAGRLEQVAHLGESGERRVAPLVEVVCLRRGLEPQLGVGDLIAQGRQQAVAVQVEHAQRRTVMSQRAQEALHLLAGANAQIAQVRLGEWWAGVRDRVGERLHPKLANWVVAQLEHLE